MQKKKAKIPNIQKTDVKNFEEIHKEDGKTKTQNQEDKLMRSVLENNKETIDQGKLISDAINQGLNSFSPDLTYEQMVNNYSIARKIMGPSIIKLISGYNPDYIKRNINIPEFQRELKSNIKKNVEKLKEKKLLDKTYSITQEGTELASLVTYFQELDNLIPKGMLGTKINKKISVYGSKEGTRKFNRSDRYKDLAVKKSVKLAIRRNHKKLEEQDLLVFERQSKGRCDIIYALDASGSMKGDKLNACKRAGIALAYKAIEEKDKVGMIAFGSEIKEAIEPTSDFHHLLRNITKIKASKQTDLASTIRKAVELFSSSDSTKHLILITDALPNIGHDPEKKTLKEVSNAKNHGITISLIGIKPDKKGEELGKKITEIGEGRMYLIRDVENIDRIVLQDYYMFN